MSAQRYQTRALRRDRVQVAPSGALRVDATPTRTGVLVYHRADGSTIRELHHPSELYSPATLASFRGVAVTVYHPSEPVTPDTWSSVAVGHVGDDVRADGDHMASSIIVQQADAVRRVQADAAAPDHLGELSCGYTCDLDHTPGVWEGQPYDAVQRNIRGNHVALLPFGEGRAGTSSRLRFDSVLRSVVDAAFAAESPCMKVKINGVEYDSGSEAHISALNAALSSATTRADTAEGALVAERGTIATLRADAIAMPAKLRAVIVQRGRRVADCKRLARWAGVTLDAAAVNAAEGDDAPADPIELIRTLLAQMVQGVDFAKMSPDMLMGALSVKMGEMGATDPDAALDGTNPAIDPSAPPSNFSTGSGLTGQQPGPRTDSMRARANAQSHFHGDNRSAPPVSVFAHCISAQRSGGIS